MELSFEELGRVLEDPETPDWVKGVLRDPELVREVVRIDEGLSGSGRILSRIMGAVQLGVARLVLCEALRRAEEVAGTMERMRYTSLLVNLTPLGTA